MSKEAHRRRKVFIRNVKVPILENVAAQFLHQASAAVVDTDGAHVTTAHWLCGQNPWGLHQDLIFSSPTSRVRQSMRIMQAAKYALQHDKAYIVLEDGDHALLLRTLQQPKRHPTEVPQPPSVARIVLPIIESIENGLTSMPQAEAEAPADSEESKEETEAVTQMIADAGEDTRKGLQRPGKADADAEPSEVGSASSVPDSAVEGVEESS